MLYRGPKAVWADSRERQENRQPKTPVIKNTGASGLLQNSPVRLFDRS